MAAVRAVEGAFFARALTVWQPEHGRKGLPWQGTRDAYRIWVSEIMLQQTQVAAVIGYYARFLARFPTLESLAGAALDEVLALWSGLGYYRRARLLHACAIEVSRTYGGSFPSDPDLLRKLPGIGRSTAAAIAVFAFGRRAAILDGNVRRVLSRYFALETIAPASQNEKLLWELAESLVPGVLNFSEPCESPEVVTYTQALMDLGATRCLPRRPACNACPLASACKAYASGEPTRYPKPRSRRRLPTRRWVFLLVRWRDQILLRKRPHCGVWASLWSLPELSPSPVSESSPSARREVRDWLMFTGLISGPNAEFALSEGLTVEQAFSHFHLCAPVLQVEITGPLKPQVALLPLGPRPADAGHLQAAYAAELQSQSAIATRGKSAIDWRWVNPREALAMGIPAVLRRLFAAEGRR
jgi:A/G-specific adenine glycosylase